MTAINTDGYPEIIPDFDPLALKDKIQAEILAETKGMTDKEICEYFRPASERVELRRKAYARRLAAQESNEDEPAMSLLKSQAKKQDCKNIVNFFKV